MTQMSLLLLAVFSPPLPFLIHVAVARGITALRPAGRRQIGAAVAAAAGAVAVPLMSWVMGAGPWPVLYLFIVYGCAGYCYFHFFNMSETSRRLRLLQGGSGGYSVQTMVDRRLCRLVETGELRIEGGRYSVGNGFLVAPALAVHFLRTALFPETAREHGQR